MAALQLAVRAHIFQFEGSLDPSDAGVGDWAKIPSDWRASNAKFGVTLALICDRSFFDLSIRFRSVDEPGNAQQLPSIRTTAERFRSVVWRVGNRSVARCVRRSQR